MKKQTIISTLIALVLGTVTMLCQRFRLTAYEESYIFLYDWDYVADQLAHPGGVAQLMSSLLTQYMNTPTLAVLIVGLVYWCISAMLCSIGRRSCSPAWVWSLSVAPCVCLMLCLENPAYRFMGDTAVLIVVMALWIYCRGDGALSVMRVSAGIIGVLCVYWAAGSAALVFALTAAAYDLLRRPLRWQSLMTLSYPVALTAIAWLSYRMTAVPTWRIALTPGAYYEWEWTAYMMLYSWCAILIYVIVVCLTAKSIKRTNRQMSSKAMWLTITAIWAAVAIAGASLYGALHSSRNAQAMRERYYVRNGMWDSLLDIDYGNQATHLFSYRSLALARRGMLVESLGRINPYISTDFVKNKTFKKKDDQQIFSDIYYECDYMGAARHSAFDTNIVTPGAFNPYETQKLVVLNIVTGDYAVAEKLISLLEKTWRFDDWAKDMRCYLYNDAAVESDPRMGAMRTAIPRDNDYLSPRGVLRDLEYICRNNPQQVCAAQFHQALIQVLGLSGQQPTDKTQSAEGF